MLLSSCSKKMYADLVWSSLDFRQRKNKLIIIYYTLKNGRCNVTKLCCGQMLQSLGLFFIDLRLLTSRNFFLIRMAFGVTCIHERSLSLKYSALYGPLPKLQYTNQQEIITNWKISCGINFTTNFIWKKEIKNLRNFFKILLVMSALSVFSLFFGWLKYISD